MTTAKPRTKYELLHPLPMLTAVTVVTMGYAHLTGVALLPPIDRQIAPPPVPELASIVLPPPPKPDIPIDQTGMVRAYFDRIAYQLEATSAVPPVLLERMPQGLSGMTDIPARKSLFFRIMLPLILTANEEIAADRAKLEAILAKSDPSPAEAAWLVEKAERYRTDPAAPQQLLSKIDEIPISLALAQSAEESGWGTSRFTREGNALFGQWAWSDDAGIVPEGRTDGQKHVIRAFDDLLGSVRAYMLNLNRHEAYDELRRLRAEARAAEDRPTGMALAGTLTSYSERGEDYIKSIQAIIRVNKLGGFDQAELADAAPSEKPPLLVPEKKT